MGLESCLPFQPRPDPLSASLEGFLGIPVPAPRAGVSSKPIVSGAASVLEIIWAEVRTQDCISPVVILFVVEKFV